MISKKQKLELTWIGKENRPRLEPRILLEVSEAFDRDVDDSIYNDQNDVETGR